MQFDSIIDMGSHIEGGKKRKNSGKGYHLSSIICHKGSSCTSGHYIAYVRRGNRWFLCNDSLVREVDEAKVLMQKEAYMLFYERVEEEEEEAEVGRRMKIEKEDDAAAQRCKRRARKKIKVEQRQPTPTKTEAIKTPSIKSTRIVSTFSRLSTRLRSSSSFNYGVQLFSRITGKRRRGSGLKISPREEEEDEERGGEGSGGKTKQKKKMGKQGGKRKKRRFR